MNKVTAFKLTAAILVALPLVGCGGGGSGSGSSGGSSSTSGLTSTTVYPSAGKFSAGTVVVVKSADGATTYGQGTVQGDGTAPVKLSGYSGGAVMLEVDGDGTGTYYDEAKAANVTFPKGAQLHAVATSASQQMAVSPLTEAAVQYIKNTGGSVTDTSAISAANGQIGAEFGLSDIVATPPTIVGSNADKVGIGTDMY